MAAKPRIRFNPTAAFHISISASENYTVWTFHGLNAQNVTKIQKWANIELLQQYTITAYVYHKLDFQHVLLKKKKKKTAGV